MNPRNKKNTRLRSRFANNSRIKNKITFFIVKREKTDKLSKTQLIYDSKLKYNDIEREIRRKNT